MNYQEIPYVIYEVFINNTYKIVDGEGFQLGPIDGKFLKHYFPEENMPNWLLNKSLNYLHQKRKNQKKKTSDLEEYKL